jgi:hypothetical protein
VRLRSPYDREIARLAVPALGALAAGPLYILADTAIVGHLGTPQLAALALAGAARCSANGISTSLAGVSCPQAAARSSSSAPSSWPATSGRGPHVSRTKPAITSPIHSSVYGWRGRSSESPCSGRSGSTTR